MKLGKLCAVIFSGGTPNTSNTEYWNGEFHWLSSGETRNTYIFNTEKTITQKGVDNSSTRLAKKNDVVIASAGQGKTRGQVSYCMIDTYINQSLISMRTNPKLLDPKFLFYNLTSRYNELRTLSDSSSSRGSLTIPILENIDILLPPLKQQKTIATILSNYDDLIDNNNKRIKILEEMAQKIYKEWFVDFKYPGHETATFKDTELGKIPNDWKYKALKDVLTYSIGGGWGNEIRSGEYTESAYVIRGTDIPNCRIGNIQNCPLRYHTLSNIKSRLLQENDIIFEVSGGSKGQPVGRSLLLNKYLLEQFNDKIICASFCKLLRADSELAYPEYMYLHLLDIYNNGEIEKYQTQSTGIINFKFTVFLEKEQVLIPSNNILQLFNAQIIPIFNNISLLGYQNSILKQTRDLLLPRLMSGEIDVENMEVV